MDGRRAKRRRHNGGQYQQLQDDTDSVRSSIIRRRENEGKSLHCDKCWSTHTRRQATKRCLNCSQNLCSYCAKIDESRRRSWWPSLLISCWRFLFLKAFKCHTIVDLEQVANSSDRNSSLSRTSTETPRSSYSRRGERCDSSREQAAKSVKKNDSNRTPELIKQNTPRQHRYYCPNAQALYRAYSFDKHLNKRKSGDHKAQHLRRTRSAERLPNKDFIDRESEFRQLYHQNWEREPFDFHRAHVGNVAANKQNATGNKENIRPNEHPTAVHESNERRFKRGKTSRRGIKHVADIFPHSPNSNTKFSESVNTEGAFQRNTHSVQQEDRSSQQSERPASGYQQNDTYRAAQAEEHLKASEPVTPYIVEEPPDLCPVCLESIPRSEARRLFCSHTIHTNCLIDLLNKMEFDFGVKCPICNQITQIRNYYIARHLWYKELPVVTNF